MCYRKTWVWGGSQKPIVKLSIDAGVWSTPSLRKGMLKAAQSSDFWTNWLTKCIIYHYIDKWLQTPWLTRINSVCYSSSFTFHYNRLWLLYSTQTHIQSRACGRDLGKGLESFHQSAFLFREEVVPGQQFAPTMSLGIILICFSYFIWYSYDIHMIFNTFQYWCCIRAQIWAKHVENYRNTEQHHGTIQHAIQYTPPVDTPSRHPCICQRKSLIKHHAVLQRRLGPTLPLIFMVTW